MISADRKQEKSLHCIMYPNETTRAYMYVTAKQFQYKHLQKGQNLCIKFTKFVFNQTLHARAVTHWRTQWRTTLNCLRVGMWRSSWKFAFVKCEFWRTNSYECECEYWKN